MLSNALGGGESKIIPSRIAALEKNLGLEEWLK
jgi:hypothetical protein